jgi:DNA-binding Xre family transcriptional regulator
MIIVKLKETLLRHRRRTGQNITYEDLAAMTGMAAGTLQSIATRQNYHPTLGNVEKLCRALDVPLHDMLEMIDDPPKPKRKAKKARARGTGRR